MGDPQKALATQLANIESRTGKSLAELRAVIQQSGLSKHGEIRDMLRAQFGLGFGDANTVAHVAKQAADAGAAGTAGAAGAAAETPEQALDRIYTGPKAALRPVHDAVMARVQAFGDFEIAPKKTYVSLRRKKQFAMVGPATNTRVEVGINHRDVPASERALAMPAKSMCSYKVNLARADAVDDELIDWIRRAYDQAG